MATKPNIIILGASSLIAPWVLERLSLKGFSGQCYSRKPIDISRSVDNFEWQPLDTSFLKKFNPQPQSIIISLLPLWLLPPLLPKLQKSQQLIAFSTTSIFGKKNSPNSEEQALIRKIMAAEEKLIQTVTKHKIFWTILRPTLIYDGQNDLNITEMARFIQKWHILPVAGSAEGLRQPVHADDLASAAVSAIGNPSGYNQSFNLGGGEILTYRQMAQRVFQVLGKTSRIIPLPPKLICTICSLLNRVTRKGPNAAMFIRMNQDLIYDLTNARQALNYCPRPFQPKFHLSSKKLSRPLSLR